MIRINDALDLWPVSDEMMGVIAGVSRDNFARFHGLARRRERCGGGLDLLDWGRKYLPDHFQLPPSNMHRWMAEQFDAALRTRGTKINVLGPRGAAKSTIGTLALPLRAAVECQENYIWIVSDTKNQACATWKTSRPNCSTIAPSPPTSPQPSGEDSSGAATRSCSATA